MKSISKKILLTLFSVVFAVCCLFFAVTSANGRVQVNADAAALEAEFTNNGEFTVSKAAWNNSYSFIDGTSLGGTGAVLQAGTSAGVAGVRINFSPSNLAAGDVASIVVKVKAANFVKGTDEFRTTSNNGSTWRQYGKTDDLTDWFNYTLNANSMSDMVQSNGTYGAVDICIRASSGNSITLYIDSITVNLRDTSGYETQTFAGVFNNASYNSLTRALLTYSGTATWNDSDDGNFKYKVMLKDSTEALSTAILANVSGVTLAHWAGQKWINIGLPGTYDTIIIPQGVHFAGVNIPAGTLTWNTSTSKWDWDSLLKETTFTQISWVNNYNSVWLAVTFDTSLWVQDGVPTSYSGIYYNGNDITDLATTVKYYLTSSVWFVYNNQATNPKLAAGYNGYTHPTIEFAEGATMEYGGHIFVFHAVKVYFNFDTSKWQTEVPDGYSDHVVEPELATFSGVWGNADGYNSSSTLLLRYTSTSDWDSTDKGTIASKITYINSSTSTSYSATNSNIAGWSGQKWLILSGLSGYDVIEIAEGGTFGGNIEIPEGTFYLVNGRWTTGAPHAANATYTAIASGWNNRLADGTSCNVLSYSVNPLGAASSATNLAATISRTSLMVKYNGSTFFDLYMDDNNANRTKYKISYEHGNRYFYFAIPEADLVDGATLVVEEGTPFMNYYLGGVTLEYNATAGEWQLPVNYTPSFVSINSNFNNDGNGFFIAEFNTTGWAQQGVPTSYSGITYNGNDITDLTSNIKFYQNNSVWFTYTVQASNAKLAANYNGYSHPTIAFAEGATMVYGGKTYTFHAVTFYLNLSTNKWQTEVPDGYYDQIENATFAGVWGNADSYNSSTSLLLQYTTAAAWDYTNKGTLASKITYRNSSTSTSYSATNSNITGWNGQKWIILSGLSGYDVIEIAEGGTFGGGNEIPAGTFYLVNGHWVNTASHASNTVFTTIHATWNNYAAGNSTSGTILTYSVNPLGAAASGTNLAATVNRTSLMVKYNGETFFDLYADTNNANRTKYSISYTHGNGHFYFTVPEADLVDGATLVVEDGTPFMNYYLEGVTITYNATSGKWQVPVNYNPSFVSINGSFNNESHGYFIAQFNTTGWEQSGVPTSYSGITYNGNNITDLITSIQFYQNNSVWFTYTPQASNPKLVANYNGYSHPTIAFAEGATMVYGGNTYTFHAVTFYLNLSTNMWQTDIPDGYIVKDYVSYTSVYSTHNNNQTLLPGYSITLIKFSGTIGSYTGTNLASTLGAYITVGGSAVSGMSGAVVQVGYNGTYTDSLYVRVPTSALSTVGASGAVEMVISSYTFGNVIIGAKTLYLIENVWMPTVARLGTPDCTFTGFDIWNNTNGITLFVFNFRNIPEEAVSYKESTGYYIRYNGTSLADISGANVYTWADIYWLRVDLPNPAEGSILTIEEGTPFAGNYLPRMVFKLVGGVWCKAFAVNITIGSDTYTYYSKDDVPIVLNDSFFEELLEENSIPAKLLSFSTRGVTYKAGTTFSVLTYTDITVETIGFDTSNGASVRLSTPTGIRFETKINKADYDELVATYGKSNIELGTYIMPTSLLDTSDFRAYLADGSKVNGTDYVKIVSDGFYNKETAAVDGYYKYYGSLVNIKPNNYCTEFFGIGYIKINAGGNIYIVYGGYDLNDHTRTIYYVSSRAYPNFDNDTTEKNALKSYLDGVVYIDDDAEISTLIDVDGYSTPYSISYNSVTGVYTVTGSAEIKSVMIGDKKRVSSRTSTLTVNGEPYYVTNYNLNSAAQSSTLTFKLSSVVDASSLVDFTLEVPSNRGIKILQLTDTEIIDAAQMRSAGALTSAQQEEYARKNIYVNCLNYISELIENDRPDLIVITGDIVNGNFDDNGSMWLRIVEFMDSFDIPWAPVFGGLDNASAKGASWQITQLDSADNCLFNSGTVTENGDYTIGITDGGVLRRVIFMLDSNGGNGISSSQINWVKSVAANIESYYGSVPAFVFFNKDSATDFSSDFATANIDGVFKGNNPSNNSTTLLDGIYYTYGTKTGSYGTYTASKVGGTYITVSSSGLGFTVDAVCLNKSDMQNKDIIYLVESYDGSNIVTDAYLKPIWDTDRIYDETGLFVGETGSVTLMYTPSDPSEVVVRDITLGVTYTYGIDYTISGNKVTRVSTGSLPYLPYDEYYNDLPATLNGHNSGFTVTPVNGKGEDGYPIVGTKYLFYAESENGVAKHVTFTYSKTEAWSGTTITGDTKAQTFINNLKSDKEATVFFYGDSITVGCNASGSDYGGNRNPYLPMWTDLVTDTLGEIYGANITSYNGSRGGWTTAQGAENLSAKLSSFELDFADVDLFVIAFGMNDPQTSQSDYISSIESMIDTYFAANATGSILLVSPMKPNTQSSMTFGNQALWESALNTIKNKAKYSGKNISLAKVYTIFNELNTVSGKLARDHLGNNVNHPNDFGVRIYAQVILKTLCGDDFG